MDAVLIVVNRLRKLPVCNVDVRNVKQNIEKLQQKIA
jgi:hypothetical protein